MYWITGLLGLILIVAPFVLNYTGSPAALLADVILGALVLIVSAYKAITHDQVKWEYWAAGILGILAIIAPFVLSFSTLTTALWVTLVLGVIVAVLSGYEVFFRRPESH
jgi:bacteriorhodopsin